MNGGVASDPNGSGTLNKVVNPSQYSDTTLTKVFVGGLAWQTKSETLHKHFAQYGDILEAVVIMDKTTGRSKGFGFVTFADKDAAQRATADPNPMIDNRRANCNLAALGAQKRPRKFDYNHDYEVQPSYVVPGSLSMHLQYQIPGSAAAPNFQPGPPHDPQASFQQYDGYEYPEGAAPVVPAPAAYLFNPYSPILSSAYSPSLPYAAYSGSPFYSYASPNYSPTSPAYYYNPHTPSPSVAHLVPSQLFTPEQGYGYGPPSNRPQGPPPPLALPQSHPNAVPLTNATEAAPGSSPKPSGGGADDAEQQARELSAQAQIGQQPVPSQAQPMQHPHHVTYQQYGYVPYGLSRGGPQQQQQRVHMIPQQPPAGGPQPQKSPEEHEAYNGHSGQNGANGSVESGSVGAGSSSSSGAASYQLPGRSAASVSYQVRQPLPRAESSDSSSVTPSSASVGSSPSTGTDSANASPYVPSNHVRQQPPASASQQPQPPSRYPTHQKAPYPSGQVYLANQPPVRVVQQQPSSGSASYASNGRAPAGTSADVAAQFQRMSMHDRDHAL